MRPQLLFRRDVLRRTMVWLTLAVLVLQSPGALAQRHASGGYTRPAPVGEARTRTPSFGGSRRERTPSTRGGYTRPTVSGAPQGSAAGGGSGSASDQALARRSAGKALETFRAQTRPEVAPRRPVAEGVGAWDGPRRRDVARETVHARQTWYDRAGWTPPRYAAQTPAQFGGWDATFMWYLLDTMARPGHTEFFHHHGDDPGYTAWRAEANRRAAEDATLRDKLAALDTRLAGLQTQPRTKAYLPPDAPLAVARASTPGTGGRGWLLGLVLLLVLVAVVLWFAWRRSQRPSSAPAAEPSPAAGVSTSLPWFRVGAALPVDPTPFILAVGPTHVSVPEDITTGGLLTIEAIGEVTASEVRWYRGYLPGGKHFVQMHLDAQGQPDECRYFALLDEITPSGPEEWAFWLDNTEGAIGWPAFQTKDGKVFARVWAHGTARVAPHVLTETLTTASGPSSRERQAMLYAAATGAEAPVPQTEYILVAAVDQAGQAWVEVYAGIDIDAHLLQPS